MLNKNYKNAPRTNMKNIQKPEKIHLGKLIEEIGKGRYVIPDFQREFDWQPWDVSDLIKSIFMDYYIGTLLLWEGNKENYNKLACAPLYAFEKELDPEYIVLDGQQRLSALHYAFFQPDVNFRNRKNPFRYFIHLEELLSENYEDAFFYDSMTKYYQDLIKNEEQQYETHTFPLGVFKGGTWDVQNWIINYQQYWNNKAKDDSDKSAQYQKYANSAQAIKDVFFDILNNYHVSYILLDKQLELNRVCDIFTHINSKGKPLDTFDLLNSVTRKSDIYLKDMYRQASGKLDDNTYPGFEIKSYIMMVMSILKQNYCSPKYLYYLVPGEKKKVKDSEGILEVRTLINTKEEFINLWDKSVNAIDKGLKSLKNPRDLGAISERFLPYPSIIPCLSAIKSFVESADLKNKVDIHSKIRKWYWSSIFLNRYSSSVESTSAKDYIELKRWFKDDEKEIECVLDFHRLYKDLDLHKEQRSGSAIYKAIYCLYILRGAPDWQTFELPEYDSLDDHHIVPKSWGKENGIEKEINSILNRTPLSSDTNRNIINNRLPNSYMKEMLENNEEEKIYKVFNSHLISKQAISILLRDPFTPEDFQDFIEERKRSITLEIENRILNEYIELPKSLQKTNDEIETIELQLRQLIIDKLGLQTFDDVKNQLPQHILDQLSQKFDRERKKNPSEMDLKRELAQTWIQFTDLQHLLQIITAKQHWNHFESMFGSKEQLTSFFNDLGAVRNSIRHSREVDEITSLKGQASILWFKKQLKIA